MSEGPPTTSAPATGAAAPAAKPPPAQNPAFQMMGLPKLPKKLPSRNWMIFWAITGAFSTAIIYDRREKTRATAKWRRAVAPLADELISSPNQLPRKLTIYLEAPPGDGLRIAQDHFIEYAKPVLSASGLDWEFVQGRMQGDIRAAVAEKIRRTRRNEERPGEEQPQTDDSFLEDLRGKMGLPEHQGIKGDIIVGRHTWKEYIRGLHEGWLGPLDPPPQPETQPKPLDVEANSNAESGAGIKPEDETKDNEKKTEDEKKPEEEKKPERPLQPVPYNSTQDYESAPLPAHIPTEFSPSALIPLPFRLGFTHTFVRLGRYLNRRKLADDIGRDIAAVCFATARDYRSTEDGQYEQQLMLHREEKDWVKSVWKEEEPDKDEDEAAKPAGPPKEKIWASPMVVDPRIVQRMRRFEMDAEGEAKAAQVVVPEEEIEGWIKGSLRSMWQWGVGSWQSKPQGPNVGNLDDE